MLIRTLESVAGGVDPRDAIEVIVVDNGSTDNTAGVCKAIEERFPRQGLRYYYDPMPGLLTGRHRGAREARGEILCYLDDDVLLESTWMGAIKEAFQNSEIVVAGGPSRPLYEVDPPLWLEDLWQKLAGGRMLNPLSLLDYGSDAKSVEPWYVWGLNFAIRKNIFHECGGFHPDGVPSYLLRYRGNGEGGLALKIKERGLQALYHPDAAVTHMIPVSRLTLKAFEQRAFIEGVSDSYARIRREGIVPPVPAESWRNALRPIEKKLRRAALWRQGDAKAVRELMVHAHAAGVEFHQNEVRNDPTLLEWVLKPDYFDYSLPRGWEKWRRSARKVLAKSWSARAMNRSSG
jgi:glycosyltransferase involved in cell wall biosynthesis